MFILEIKSVLLTASSKQNYINVVANIILFTTKNYYVFYDIKQVFLERRGYFPWKRKL